MTGALKFLLALIPVISATEVRTPGRIGRDGPIRMTDGPDPLVGGGLVPPLRLRNKKVKLSGLVRLKPIDRAEVFPALLFSPKGRQNRIARQRNDEAQPDDPRDSGNHRFKES